MQIAQEAEHACDYKAIFDIKKHYGKDYYAMGVVSLSFSTRCDLIFINIKNSFRIVERIAAWRPKAHICVFTYKYIVMQ